MASILGNPNCSTKFGNVGTPSCGFGIEYLQGFVLTEDSFSLSAANLADFSTALGVLQAATYAPVGQRIFPFFNVIALTDNTPAPEQKVSGYGIGQGTIEKSHSFEIELKDFGGEYFKQVRKFNGRKDLRIFWIDRGFVGGEETSTGGLRGFTVSNFHAKQVKVGNIADVTKYMVQIDLFDPSALTDKLVSFAIPETTTISSELKGVLNVNLTGVAGGSHIANVTVETAISKINLYDEYSTELAATAAWDATGISSVTAVPATKSFDILFSGAGAKTINLKSAAALVALGIGGDGSSAFEGTSISVTVS